MVAMVMGMDKKKKRVESAMEDLVIDDGAGDGNGAGVFVLPGEQKNSVEIVLDSSRYFVLKIENGATAFSF